MLEKNGITFDGYYIIQKHKNERKKKGEKNDG